MKSTKILAATLSLVSLIGLSACGAKKPADTVSLPDISGKPDQSVTQQQPPDLETEPVLPENIYEAENFTFNTSFPDAVGGIKLVDATANYVVDEEGTVFDTGDGRKLYADASPAEYVIAQNNVHYKNSEGYIIINEGGREYICSDIKGDIFYTFKGMLDGALYVFSVDGKGAMYLNSFKESGLKDDYDNEPFYIYDSKDKTLHRNVDKIAVTDTLNPRIYAEIGNKTFYDNVTGTMKVDGKQCFFFSSLDYEFDKIFDFGFNHQFTSPLYSKNDNDTKLYFKDGWSDDEFAVNLPDGYKVSDIKDAIFAYSTVITMNDGTVWTGETQYTVLGTDLTKHEKLSEVSSHIVSLHPSNLTNVCSVMAIMDDNKIYKATLG